MSSANTDPLPPLNPQQPQPPTYAATVPPPTYPQQPVYPQQAPYPQQPASTWVVRVDGVSSGLWVGGIAALVTLLSFVAFPFLQFFIFSFTAMQIAQTGGDATWLWLIPLGAVLACGAAAYRIFVHPAPLSTPNLDALALLFGGILCLAAFLITIVRVVNVASTSAVTGASLPINISPLSFIGLGFWLCLLGPIGIIAGAIAALRAKH